MRRPSYAVPALILFSTLVLGAPSAGALPRATAENCNWSQIHVTDKQAEECQARGGSFACLAGQPNELLCCTTNAQGGQDCEALAAIRPGEGNITTLLGGILQSTQATASLVQQLNVAVQGLVRAQGEPSICTSDDFVPENITCPASPTGNLVWTVYNEGSSETDLVGTIASTTFDILGLPPVVVNTPIPPLAAGGSHIVTVPIPPGCNGCTGTVAVNTTNSATPIELIVSNNIASFTCPFIQ